MIDGPLRDTSTSLLVEAGAGCGKTTALARRMVAVILDGEDVGHLAAITFTRKAAGELRGRFQNELERALAGARDPASRERLSEALRRLEQAFTGTVHAFAARLLRERPVEAGVPPGFREAQPAEDALLREEAFRETLERLHDRGDPDLESLRAAGIRPDDLQAAFAVLCDYDEVEFPAPGAPAPDPAPAFEAFRSWWGPFERCVPDPVPAGSTCKLQHHAEEIRLALPGLAARFEDPGRLADFLEGFETDRTAILKHWSLPKDEVRALEASRRAFAEGPAAAFLSAWRAHLYGLALPVLLEARTRARERRRREGRLNYQDLLLLAAGMLRSSPAALSFFRGRYRRLFVDEFQDTDPVQAEILELLGDRPGSLFVVGDPKQSIYRFRRADLATYARIRERILAGGGRTVPLDANYRSGAGVLDWVNRAFAGLPGYRPLRAAAGGPPGSVEFLTLPGGADEAPEAVARLVRGALDAGTHTPGDFLVLTQRKAKLLPYARALEAAGVPFEATAGASFSESPEVRLFVELCLALADPDDPVASVGILRGRLFAVADDALFLHRKAGGHFRFVPPPQEGAPGSDEVLEALRILGGWHARTRTLPPAAAMEVLLEASGLLALSASGEGASLSGGALFQALERGRTLAESGTPFPEIARALREDLGTEELESAPLEPGRSDVLRLMNLHKAKGLEARVVVLADPAPHRARSGVRVRVVRDGQGARGFLRIDRAIHEFQSRPLAHPADWAEHEAAEEAELEAERARLRYVAATRAKERLVVLRLAKPTPSAQRLWPWWPFEPFLQGASEARVPAEIPRLGKTVPDLTAKSREAAAAIRRARLEKALAPSTSTLSATSLSPEPAPGTTKVEGPAGPVWGRLVHGLLEAALRTPGADPAAVARVLSARLEEEDLPVPEDWIPRAVAAAASVAASGLWKEALASSERHAEVPIKVPWDAKGEVLGGILDLVFRSEKGWVLVDWKTDAEEDPERHRAQLEAYARAWTLATGEPVVRKTLFYVRTGRRKDL